MTEWTWLTTPQQPKPSRTRRILHGRSDDDYDAIVRAAGDCRLVLIGEASHGTHEFYETQAQITLGPLSFGVVK